MPREFWVEFLHLTPTISPLNQTHPSIKSSTLVAYKSQEYYLRVLCTGQNSPPSAPTSTMSAPNSPPFDLEIIAVQKMSCSLFCGSNSIMQPINLKINLIPTPSLLESPIKCLLLNSRILEWKQMRHCLSYILDLVTYAIFLLNLGRSMKTKY